MNKLYKLFITATAIASVLGWNSNVAQAQSRQSYCTASAIGALLGLAITGDAETAASVIPSECTENEPAPQRRSYQYQAQNRPQLLAAFTSEKSDRQVGIDKNCVHYFYNSGDLVEKCTSFINSGYTRPRKRTTDIRGRWRRSGNFIYVKVRTSSGLSGSRKYEITDQGLVNVQTRTRLIRR
ncbi:hypothetical protein [Nodularia spumigena]|uniref:hypothetical protein n=1 Tax=Nodularia spumigena TaxID=70799 RepID=UPI001F32453B|nr:hypothetical protein [Nodularia spumigena]